jgi:hypothetical protein
MNHENPAGPPRNTHDAEARDYSSRAKSRAEALLGVLRRTT